MAQKTLSHPIGAVYKSVLVSFHLCLTDQQ